MRSGVVRIVALQLRARRLVARRAMRDIALGARLAVAGGRPALTRLALAATGVAISVTTILVISGAPSVLATGEHRAGHRIWQEFEGTNDPLLHRMRETVWRGELLTVVQVEATGPTAPVPPGVDRTPGPGEAVVSPALRRALDSEAGALLRPRVPGTVVGEIGPTGLASPDELYAYVGVADLVDANTVHAFQTEPPYVPRDLALSLMLALGVLVAAVPMVVLVAASARIGSATRDRRLAAIRLVGVSRAAAVRMVAGETLVGVAAGLVAAAGLFTAAVLVAGHVEVAGRRLFAEALWPEPAVVAALVAVVAVVAVGAAVVALRPVLVEPLGVVREAVTGRRRLWWRVPPAVVATALLAWPARRSMGEGGPLGFELAVLGIGLMMMSAALVLPWLLERVTRALPPAGPASWEIARGALRADGGAAARVLGVVTSALLGTIALQTFGIAAVALQDPRPGSEPQPGVVRVEGYGDVDLEPLLRGVPGVREEWTYRFTYSTGQVGPSTSLVVGDCAALAAVADLPSCADGDAFVLEQADRALGLPPELAPRAGDVLTIPAASNDRAADVRWTAPADMPTVPPTELGRRAAFETTILVTPGSLAPGTPLHGARAVLRVDPRDRDAVEHVRNALIGTSAEAYSDEEVSAIREEWTYWPAIGLALGSIGLLTLAVGVVSLVALAIEGVRARRHALATLVAGGCRRRVLAAALGWQLAVPVAAAVLFAITGGVGLGVVLGLLVGVPPAVSWVTVAIPATAAAITVALATAAALPVLRRACRVAELRTE